MLPPYLLFWRLLSYFSKEEILRSSFMGEWKPEGCRPASLPMWSTQQPRYGATLACGNSRNRNLGLPNQCVFEFYWTCAIQLKRTGNDGDTAPNQGSDMNSDNQHRATVSVTAALHPVSSWHAPHPRCLGLGKEFYMGPNSFHASGSEGWKQFWLLCLDITLILLCLL